VIIELQLLTIQELFDKTTGKNRSAAALFSPEPAGGEEQQLENNEYRG
jgi:hypothetical protein